MLVLSRKKGEKIVINNDIVVEVVEIRRDGKVRLGIIAPKEVPVHREEVWIAIHGRPDSSSSPEGLAGPEPAPQ